jgi:hypothetical protein
MNALTRDEVIQMAREAGFDTGSAGIGVPPNRISINDTTDAPWMLDAMTDFAAAAYAKGQEDMREVCGRAKAGKPRELKPVGRGSLLGEQQFCFDKGWREGAASVRAAIRARPITQKEGEA